MAAGPPVLVCEGLSVAYATRRGELPVVRDFDLTIGSGEAHGLVGESGCGKSTVALAIMRYLGRSGRIENGSIRFKGRELTTMGEAELRSLRGSEIAMVYQEPMASLNPSMTIGRQLAEVPRTHLGVPWGEARAQALEMLEAVRLPDPERVMSTYPHQLSGGQQQRVVIAMALLGGPSLLLLDEPTTALDVTIEAGIVAMIGEIAQRFGTALLYISHNLGLILETCDRLTVMYAGEAVETGPVAQVFDHVGHPYTRGLLDSLPRPAADKRARPLRPIPGQLPPPGRGPQGCQFGPRCAWFEPGRCDAHPIAMEPVAEGQHAARCCRQGEIDLRATSAPKAVPRVTVPGPPALEVVRLTKHYPVENGPWGALLDGHEARLVRANEGLDFLAREAQTVAVVGESGCGKSTLAKVLAGLETATAGEARLHGQDIAATPVEKRRRPLVAGLQMIFQNPFDTLNPSQKVGAQIGRVVRKLGGERDRRRVRARVMELLDLVKLPREVYGRRPRQLSGGQKQRVGIARAFAGKPALVIADEPVSALDVSVQAAIAQLLMEIQRRNRTTLLFISHDLSLVRYLADRVIVMYLGRIMEQGPVAAVFRPPYHPYTEALLAAVPVPDTRASRRRVLLDGEIPSALEIPTGCPFHTRCHRKLGAICEREEPPLRRFADGHTILCHIEPEELEALGPVLSFEAQEDAAGV
jgi:peptide/nickel transport system ATP-binding protein